MTASSRTYRFDIGNQRPDGKRNVWTLLDVRGLGPEWVVVHVGEGLHAALEWIKAQRGK